MQSWNATHVKPLAAAAEKECAAQYVKGHPTGRTTAARQAYVTECYHVWYKSVDNGKA